MNWKEERKLNTETFGVGSSRYYSRGGYRGRGGFRGRGGPWRGPPRGGFRGNPRGGRGGYNRGPRRDGGWVNYDYDYPEMDRSRPPPRQVPPDRVTSLKLLRFWNYQNSLFKITCRKFNAA